jgi:hypothetical protein
VARTLEVGGWQVRQPCQGGTSWEMIMKYVVTWKLRASGSAAENEEAAERGLQVFAGWSPPADSDFVQFLTRLDGEGGFAVVDSDNPLSVLDGPAKFSPYFEFSVYPVVDIMTGIPVATEAVAFRKGIS